MDPVSFRPWIAFPLLVAACCCANAERQFQGLYTIVNVATERKLVADAQGFYTAAFDSIPKTQIWSITAGENATHTIQNAASGVRIYAQVGQERQRGFFVINSDTPVFRDQRWELQWQKAGGGYIIKNLKSQRAISDGPDGLMATVDLQPGSFWWIISQQRDEIGMELAKLEQSDDYQPGRAEEASKRFGIADGLEVVETDHKLAFLAVIFILMVFRFFRGRGPDPDDFSYHIYKTEADGAPVEQVVRVQCPGVRHEDIEVKLIPNGCDVILHRRALPGLKEICWKHRFHFSLADGFFEFVEERMQLEHGFLILVLRAVNQDRTIRFAQHFQHFCMDAFDDEKLSFMARSCFKWHKPWIQGSTGTTLPWMQLRPASAKHQKVRTFCLWLAAAKAHRCHD
eukprot:g21499.t1